MKPPSRPSPTGLRRPSRGCTWSPRWSRCSTRTPPGRPGALLRPAPLRTVRAAFTAHGSSKPLGLAGVQMLRVAATFGGVPSLAAGVDETGVGLVRRVVHSGGGRDDRRAGGR